MYLEIYKKHKYNNIYEDVCNSKYRLNLQFFAEGSGGEKTEEPTEHKKEKAREEGQVAKSVEVNTALIVLGLFFMLQLTAKFMYDNLLLNMHENFILISEAEDLFNTERVMKHVSSSFGNVIFTALPLLMAAMVIGVVANIIQVGWNPTLKALQPKFNRLNPLEGFKRIFSKKAILELLKSVGKFALISIIIYTGITKELVAMINLINVPADESVAYIGGIVISLAMKVGMFFVVIAVIDFIFQKRELKQNLMMTKQEIKDEYKQMEGDPQIKQQRKQMHRQMSMKQMMSDAKTADVVITNPTHFAVAIKYDQNSGKPPKVVAKGADYIALRIKEIAKESKVEIVENKPLARTLFATTEVGDSIPEDLYQAVAEVLAFVYKLRGM